MVLCVITVGVSIEADTPSTDDSSDVPVDYVTVSPSNRSMIPGDEYTLSATVNPTNATDRDVTWSSSNPNVVSVSGHGNTCTITAKAAGTAQIWAEAGGKSDYCRVTVDDIQIKLGKTSVILVEGEDYHMDVSVIPSKVESELSVTSSNSSVVWWADSYMNQIRADSEGTATLTFEVRGVKATCSVEVIGGSINVYSNSIDINLDTKGGVSLSGSADRYDNQISGTLTASVSSAGMSGGTISTEAGRYLDKYLSIASDRASWAPLKVEMDGGSSSSISLNQSTMAMISDAGSSLSVSSDGGSVILDSTSVEGLSGATWSFSVVEVENTTSIEGAKLYQINMKSGTNAVSSVDGVATISISYDIMDSAMAANLSVFNVAADGTITHLDTSYDSIHGSVSVSLKSWGTIGVSTSGTVDDGTGTSMLSYVVLGVIIVLAALCLVFSYRYLRM